MTEVSNNNVGRGSGMGGSGGENLDDLVLPPPRPPPAGDDGNNNENEADNLDEDFVQLDGIYDDDDEDGDDGNDNYNGNDDDDQGNNRTNSSLLGSPTGGVGDPRQSHDQQQRQGLPPWMDRPHPPFVTDYNFFLRRNNSNHSISSGISASSTGTNPLVALHNEIVWFCKLMEPRPEEMKQRNELVTRFTELAESVFGGPEKCKVELFGSQLTGLCLPSSDIDIAIQLPQEVEVDNQDGDNEKTEVPSTGNNSNRNEGGSGSSAAKKKTEKQQEMEDMKNWDTPTGSPLQRLAAALREQWIDELSYLEVIEKTRVPLVKFQHEPTGIQVDVCFNQTTGPQAATLVHSYMRSLPPLRPLTFVLKSFLASRGLNQPYTGGIGSFMLQMMIVSFLQHRERDSLNSHRPSFPNLGALLVEFLEFFSTDFNFITVGISVRYDGFFFPKGTTDRKEDFWNPSRPFSLAMENPLDPKMDVGAPSFRIQWIQRSFEVAFKMLLAHVSEPLVPTKSVLGEILPVTDEMNQRRWDNNHHHYPRGSSTSTSEQPPKKKHKVWV